MAVHMPRPQHQYSEQPTNAEVGLGFKEDWLHRKAAETEATGVSLEDIEACKDFARQHDLAFLSWKDLSVTITRRGTSRSILEAATGYIEPRQILALMGPSGSGKSTLLDALAGRLSRGATQLGQVHLNGKPSVLSFGTAAYVQQEDLLIGTLTVQETLVTVAELRLPGSYNRSEKFKIVDDTLVEMGLEDVKDSYVGNWALRGISGGQKRRLSLACEILTRPTIIFLDEPTSGLDAAAAYQIVRYIRKLSLGCRTIVMSIHQPSSEAYNLFSQLCLLAQGKSIFFGPAAAAANLFQNAGLPVPPMTNPADHFLHCINADFLVDAKDNINSLIAAYLGSSEQVYMLETIQGFQEQGLGEDYKPDRARSAWFHQTRVLTSRALKNNTRDLGVFWMRLIMYTMLCICLGFVFFQLDHSWKSVYSRAALLFFVVAFLTFMAIAAFPAFIEDMKIFTKERLNGYYGVSQFVAANTLAAIPFIFLITVISTMSVYYLASLNTRSDRVVFFIVDLFLSLLVTESLFMAVAPLVPNFLAGIAVGAGLMGLFMIVCGFFQPTAQLPKPLFVYPLHYISFHTYSFFGFMHNEFDEVDDWGCPCSAQPGACETCIYKGDEVLAYYAISGLSKWANMGILAAMIVVYRFAFFCTLKLKESLSK